MLRIMLLSALWLVGLRDQVLSSSYEAAGIAWAGDSSSQSQYRVVFEGNVVGEASMDGLSEPEAKSRALMHAYTEALMVADVDIVRKASVSHVATNGVALRMAHERILASQSCHISHILIRRWDVVPKVSVRVDVFFRLTSIRREDPEDIGLEVHVDRHAYEVGESITVGIRAKARLRLQIFHLDNHSVTTVLPNRYTGETTLDSGTVCTFPRSGLELRATLENPATRASQEYFVVLGWRGDPPGDFSLRSDRSVVPLENALLALTQLSMRRSDFAYEIVPITIVQRQVAHEPK
jgi:hypothetical protein